MPTSIGQVRGVGKMPHGPNRTTKCSRFMNIVTSPIFALNLLSRHAQNDLSTKQFDQLEWMETSALAGFDGH